MAWGSAARSCDGLLSRVEKNDPQLTNLVILPTKKVTQADWDRLILALQEKQQQQQQRDGASLSTSSSDAIGKRHLVSIQASGHEMTPATLQRLGQAIASTSQSNPWNLLAVGHAEMGNDGVDALCQGLAFAAGNLKLKAMDLSYKGISGQGLDSIIELLQNESYTTSLNLSRNPNLVGIEWSTERQGPIFEHLTELDLTESGIQGDSACQLLSSLSAEHLRVLRLSDNALGPSVFTSPQAMPRLLFHTPLQEIYLAQCNINDDDMEHLFLLQSTVADVSSSSSSSSSSLLRVMDLSENQFGPRGARALAQSFKLKKNTLWCHLQHLNLAGNAILFEGVDVLVREGLRPREHDQQQQQAPPLQSLDLSETQCTAEGALLAISDCGGVSHLRLFNNELGSEGFQMLAPTLIGGHATLESLDLAGNGADLTSVLQLLRGLLQTDTTFVSKLNTLVVGGNKSGPDLQDLVQQIRQIRPNLDIAYDRLRRQ